MPSFFSYHKTKWFLTFIVLPLLFLFMGCFSNPDVLYMKAVKLIEKNKLARAEKLLFKVLRIKRTILMPNTH